jgi:hypothetical protein
MESYDEKEQLRGFALRVLPRVAGALSAEALAPIRTTNSLRGLREAARDMVEACADLDPQQLAELDSELAAAGLPSVAFMRNSRRVEFARVLSRAQIETSDEYRLLDGFVSDLGSGLDPGARALAERLLGQFNDSA